VKLMTMTQVSVDGVMQGSGGPDADRRGGFERGGWARRPKPLSDGEVIAFIGEVYLPTYLPTYRPGAHSTQRPRRPEAAAMVHMESLWLRLAELPLVVESCEYDRLHAVLAHGSQRVTTPCSSSAPAQTGSGRMSRSHRGRRLAARDAAHAAARGRVDACRLLRTPRDARSVAQAAGVGGGPALSQLGVRVGGAGPRIAPGRSCSARRARP
jgi:hypothetical protein